MMVSNKYILVLVFTTICNNVVSGTGDEYSKTKVDLMEKALKAFTNQKETIEKIKKKADEVTKKGNEILEEFVKNSANLRPALRHKATEPFLNIIQDYLNSFTEIRQNATVGLKKVEIHKERAVKEFEESEKSYVRISKIFKESTDNKKIVEATIGQVKTLMITRDRLNEIYKQIGNIEKTIKSHTEKIEFASRKVVSYRYLLELVTRGRNTIVASKNLYIDSFAIKDRILYGYNRVESIYRKGKLLIGEARRRGLYKVDLDKIESLLARIGKLNDKMGDIMKNTIKTWESLKNIVGKMEQNEKLITEVGNDNKKTPNTGYTKAKNYYQIIVKLRKMLNESNEKLKEYKKNSVEIVKNTNTMFRDIDTIMKRKTVLNRKVPMLINPIKVKAKDVELKTKELKDVKSTVTQSDDDTDSDTDSESESEYEISKKRTKKLTDQLSIPTVKSSSKKPKNDSSSGTETDSSTDSETDLSSSEGEFQTTSEGDGKYTKKKDADLLDDEGSVIDVGNLSKRKKKRKTRGQLNKSRSRNDSESGTDSSADSGSETSSVKGSYDVSDLISDEDSYEEILENNGKDKKDKKGGKGKKIEKKKKGTMKKAFGFLKSVLNSGIEDREEKLSERIEKLQPSSQQAEDESIDVDKAKKDFESRMDGLNLAGKTRGDVLKLIELAYALKVQFELVKDEIKDTSKFKAVELIKRILLESLHLYLTGVCTVVLEVTKTSAEKAIFPSAETITSLVTKM